MSDISLFEIVGQDIITEPGLPGRPISPRTRLLALLVIYKAGGEIPVTTPGDPDADFVRVCVLDDQFYKLAKQHGLKRRQVDRDLKILERWPKANPLISRRKSGYHDELHLRDRDGVYQRGWAKLWRTLFEAMLPFWVLRSILLLRCNYHYTDRQGEKFWVPKRHGRDKGRPRPERRNRGSTELDLTRIAPRVYGHHNSQTTMVELLLDALRQSGVATIYPDELGRHDYEPLCTLDDGDPAKLATLNSVVVRFGRPAAVPRPVSERKPKLTAKSSGWVTEILENAQGCVTESAAEADAPISRLCHTTAQVVSQDSQGCVTDGPRLCHAQNDSRLRPDSAPTPRDRLFLSEKGETHTNQPVGKQASRAEGGAHPKTGEPGLVAASGDSALGGNRLRREQAADQADRGESSRTLAGVDVPVSPSRIPAQLDGKPAAQQPAWKVNPLDQLVARGEAFRPSRSANPLEQPNRLPSRPAERRTNYLARMRTLLARLDASSPPEDPPFSLPGQPAAAPTGERGPSFASDDVGPAPGLPVPRAAREAQETPFRASPVPAGQSADSGADDFTPWRGEKPFWWDRLPELEEQYPDFWQRTRSDQELGGGAG